MSDWNNRFPRANRLTKPSDFREVFNTSCRSADSSFLVLARRNRLHRARLGLAISKKRVHAAVIRNRLKRLIREAFRQHKDELKGLDIVVLAQKDTEHQDNHVIEKSLLRHWQRLVECEQSSPA